MTTWKHSSIKGGKKKKQNIESFDNRNCVFNEPFTTNQDVDITTKQCAIADLEKKTNAMETNAEEAMQKTVNDVKQNVADRLKQASNILSGSDNNVNSSTSVGYETTSSSSSKHAKDMSDGVKNALSTFGNIITQMVRKTIAVFTYLFSLLQSFMIQMNEIINDLLVKIANALTNGNTSDYELNIFKNQTFRLLTVFLVWIFLYNWFFVIAFLIDDTSNEKNLDPTQPSPPVLHQRFLFNIENALGYKNVTTWQVKNGEEDNIPQRKTIIYMLFGPAAKVIEYFNYAVVEIPAKLVGKLKKNSLFERSRISIVYPMVFLLMAVIFIILVICDFQQLVISDFFLAIDSLNFGKIQSFTENVMTSKSPSRIIVFVFVFIVVMWFSNQQYFFYNPYFKGCLEIFKTSVLGMLFGGLCIMIGWVVLMVYHYFISLPLGFIFIFIHVFMYSFFALAIYSLYYRINIAIYILDMNGLLYFTDSYNDSWLDVWKKSTLYKNSEEGGGLMNNILSFFLTIFPLAFPLFLFIHIVRLSFKTIIRYLLQIVVGCILLYGIGVYIQNYNNINIPKLNTTNLGKSVFGQLFTWLIMINIILILLLYVSMRIKMNYFKDFDKEGDEEYINAMDQQNGGGGNMGDEEYQSMDQDIDQSMDQGMDQGMDRGYQGIDRGYQGMDRGYQGMDQGMDRGYQGIDQYSPRDIGDRI